MQNNNGYENHYAHLEDLVDLFNLKLASRNEKISENCISRIRAKADHIAAREKNTVCFLPVLHLTRALSLTPLEQRLVYSLAACAYADPESSEPVSIRSLLELEQPFFHSRLFSVTLQPQFSRFLLSSTGVNNNFSATIHPRIVQFLLAPDMLREVPFCQVYAPESPSSWYPLSAGRALLRIAKDQLAKSSRSSFFLWLHGAAGSGRRTLVKIISDNLEIPIIFADAEALLSDKGSSPLDELVRESLLLGAPVCFCCCDFLISGQHLLFRTLLHHIQIISGLCFFTSEQAPSSFLDGSVPLYPFAINTLQHQERLELFRHLAGSCAFEPGLDDNKMLLTLHLSPAQLKAALFVITKEDCGKEGGCITEHRLLQALQMVSCKGLSTLGRIVDPIHSWDDLVLPETQKKMLKEAVGRVAYQHKVFDQWGYRTKQKNKGISLLLTGPPGTGKTMAAGVIAKEVGLPMYKVDLSMITSKYIGETEKNLRAVFDEAQSNSCLLFFDEADSIFGKRTEVRDAHDKYANMDVSYLLQRLEEHNGITVLATNFLQNFDEAFRRRFHYIVEFTLPDSILRRELWNKSVPPEAPQSQDLDFELLSRYPVSPSVISSVSLAAAYLAAAGDSPISMKHITQALLSENEKGALGLDLDQLLFYL